MWWVSSFYDLIYPVNHGESHKAGFNPRVGIKIYAILTRMNETPQIWKNWVNTLHRWGLQEITAVVLDAIKPLNLLGAQVVYMGQPIFKQLVANDQLEAFASMLEDPTQTQAFISLLETTHHND